MILLNTLTLLCDTFEFSRKQVTYLDTNVHVDPNSANKILVKTHIKVTNKQAYTHASSLSPICGKGIAIGEAIRSIFIHQMNARGCNS